MDGRREVVRVQELLYASHPRLAASCGAQIPDFWQWLEDQLEQYWSEVTLHDRLLPISAEIAWLQDALKDLERDDRQRLVSTQHNRMPDRAEAACFHAAHSLFGTTWNRCVAVGSTSNVADAVRWAVASLERHREKHPERRPRTKDRRDQLFRAIVDKLETGRQFKTRAALREAADGFLLAAGVPPVAGPDSAAEDARRARTRADRRSPVPQRT